NQFIANLVKTDDTLVIIAVSGNIDDLSAANKCLVELCIAEEKRSADQGVDADARTLCVIQSVAEQVHRSGIMNPRPRHHHLLFASPSNEGDCKDWRVEPRDDIQHAWVFQRFQIAVLLGLVTRRIYAP